MSIPPDTLPYCYFKGQVLPVQEATISIMAKVVQYGMGWFTGVRGYVAEDGKTLYIFRLKDHVRRFLASAKVLGVSIKESEEELAHIITSLVSKNAVKNDVYIRPFAFADSLELSPSLKSNPIFSLAVYLLSLGDYIPTHEGISVCVSTYRRPTDLSIPSRAKISGAYINSALAKKEALDNGFVEAIMLNQNGKVAEGSAMNIFLVKKGVLVTPAITEDILEGISRDTILTLAKEAGIPCEERVVDKTELYTADEVFFTGTGAQVAWISHVDRRKVGTGSIGPVTKTLQDQFFKIVRHGTTTHSHWLTKVVNHGKIVSA